LRKYENKMIMTSYLDTDKYLLKRFTYYWDKNLPLNETIFLEKETNMHKNLDTLILELEVVGLKIARKYMV
jgi:hypothetical protein